MLRQARRADMQRAAWKVGAGVVAGFGLLSLVVALLVILLVSPGVVGSVAALAAVAVPFFVAMLGWVRARALTGDRDAAIEKAWTLAASDVLAHRGAELTAETLAKTMRIEVADAEHLLTQLNVHDFARARVTEEGDVTYSVTPDRVRVATDGEEPEEDEAQVRARAHAEVPKP